MTNLDQWGIDIFKIAEMTNNRPLTAVTYTILQVSKTSFEIDIYKKVANFIMEKGE